MGLIDLFCYAPQPMFNRHLRNEPFPQKKRWTSLPHPLVINGAFLSLRHHEPIHKIALPPKSSYPNNDVSPNLYQPNNQPVSNPMVRRIVDRNVSASLRAHGLVLTCTSLLSMDDKSELNYKGFSFAVAIPLLAIS